MKHFRKCYKLLAEEIVKELSSFIDNNLNAQSTRGSKKQIHIIINRIEPPIKQGHTLYSLYNLLPDMNPL
nr:hypothetical protein CFP56_14573 [Quercus suber]